MDGEFPVLFEDQFVRIYKNSSNDIFIENIRSRMKMRIEVSSLINGGGFRFTTDGRVEPVQIGSVIGWNISRR